MPCPHRTPRIELRPPDRPHDADHASPVVTEHLRRSRRGTQAAIPQRRIASPVGVREAGYGHAPRLDRSMNDVPTSLDGQWSVIIAVVNMIDCWDRRGQPDIFRRLPASTHWPSTASATDRGAASSGAQRLVVCRTVCRKPWGSEAGVGRRSGYRAVTLNVAQSFGGRVAADPHVEGRGVGHPVTDGGVPVAPLFGRSELDRP